MLSFSEIFQLREDKARFIKALPIDDNTKNDFIIFFIQHPNLENKIENWQAKSQEEKEAIVNQIKLLIADNKESRKSVKRNIKEDLSLAFKPFVEKGEAKIWAYTDKYILVSPLSYECANFMNDHKCYGPKAKWCIGTQGDTSYWRKHILGKACFLFVFYDNKKWMLEIKPPYGCFDDEDIDQHIVTLWDDEDENLACDDLYDALYEQIKVFDKNENDLVQNILDNIVDLYIDYRKNSGLMEVAKKEAIDKFLENEAIKVVDSYMQMTNPHFDQLFGSIYDRINHPNFTQEAFIKDDDPEFFKLSLKIAKDLLVRVERLHRKYFEDSYYNFFNIADLLKVIDMSENNGRPTKGGEQYRREAQDLLDSWKIPLKEAALTFHEIFKKAGTKTFKEKPITIWTDKDKQDYLLFVDEHEDPNKSRALPTGMRKYLSTHLTPRGETSWSAEPWEVVAAFKDICTEEEIIKLCKKIYINLWEDAIKSFLKYLN